MRRLAAILLILTSGWLLYQSSEHFAAVGQLNFEQLIRQSGNLNFMLPAAGGLLGLLGGLIVLFGGVGGAVLAMIGGVVAAGFAIYIGKPLWSGDWQIWNNEATVGLVMLILAGLAAVLGRD